MTDQEIANIAKNYPHSFSQVKEIHDKLPAHKRTDEEIRKAINTGFAFAYAETLTTLERMKGVSHSDITELMETPMPKPNFISRLKSFFWLIGFKLKIIK